MFTVEEIAAYIYIYICKCQLSYTCKIRLDGTSDTAPKAKKPGLDF